MRVSALFAAAVSGILSLYQPAAAQNPASATVAQNAGDSVTVLRGTVPPPPAPQPGPVASPPSTSYAPPAIPSLGPGWNTDGFNDDFDRSGINRSGLNGDVNWSGINRDFNWSGTDPAFKPVR